MASIKYIENGTFILSEDDGSFKIIDKSYSSKKFSVEDCNELMKILTSVDFTIKMLYYPKSKIAYLCKDSTMDDYQIITIDINAMSLDGCGLTIYTKDNEHHIPNMIKILFDHFNSHKIEKSPSYGLYDMVVKVNELPEVDPLVPHKVPSKTTLFLLKSGNKLVPYIHDGEKWINMNEYTGESDPENTNTIPDTVEKEPVSETSVGTEEEPNAEVWNKSIDTKKVTVKASETVSIVNSTMNNAVIDISTKKVE